MYGKIYKWKQEKPKEAVCVPPPAALPTSNPRSRGRPRPPANYLSRPAATAHDSPLSFCAAARCTSPSAGC